MKAKFKIGDIVELVDDFHCDMFSKTRSIGKIQAIHIHIEPDWRDSQTVDVSNISYTISGFSIRPDERNLKLAKNY